MQGTSGSRSNMSCQIAISNKRTGLPARRAKGAYRSLESVPCKALFRNAVQAVNLWGVRSTPRADCPVSIQWNEPIHR